MRFNTHVILIVGLAGQLAGVWTTTALGISPVDRFVKALAKNDALPVEARDLIRQRWAACEDCDEEEFLTQGLALFSEKFREGLDVYDADRYERCATIMGSLVKDGDLFVATHAAAYEIKSLVAQEKLLEAKQRIDSLLTDDGLQLRDFSYFPAEISFLRGFCLLADLQYQQADTTLRGFLAEFPEAPQRLTMAAMQMLLELDTRQPERIGDVVDLMGFSGRRLTHGDSGERVQQRQTRIVELLDKLIKEAEQREQSGGNSGSNSRSRGRQSPRQPMPDSRLPGGQAKEGPLRDGRRANPADFWGAMPPAERERVLQALRDSFPSRYRQLVEQYYEELAKKP